MPDHHNNTIRAGNHKYRWHTVWYMCTVAFDCILYYLKQHEGKTTKNTTLQEFQWYITSHIDDFITSDIEHVEWWN